MKGFGVGHGRCLPIVSCVVVYALFLTPGCSSNVSSTPVTKDVNVPVATLPAVASTDTPSTETPASLVVKKRSAETLRDRVRLTVERMHADAGPRRRRQALWRIRQALLAYEQKLQHMPPGDGQVSKGEPTGLSWRVHLLPFLNETALYEQFHLDEPWDSAGNLPLVERMPKVYGDDALGLSRIHRPLGLKPDDKLLLVDTREDAGEFWTKPGGLGSDATGIPEWIAMRGGDLYAVPSTVTEGGWQAWWKSDHSLDTTSAWMTRFPIVIRDKFVELDTNAGEVASATESLAIPTDSFGVIRLRPRALCAHSLFGKRLKEVMTEPPSGAADGSFPSWLVPYIAQIRGAGAWLRGHHLRFDEIDTLAVVVPSRIFSGPVQSTEGFAVVCTAAGDFDVEALVEAEMESNNGFQYREQGATIGIVDQPRSFAMHFANGRTVLLGGQTLVVKLSEARPEDHALTARIASTRPSPLLLAVDLAPVQRFLQQRPLPFPPAIQEAMPDLMKAEYSILSIDPAADLLLEVTISFREASAATAVQSYLIHHIESLRTRMASRSPAAADDPVSMGMAALMNGVKLQAHGTTLQLTVTRPEEFDALIGALLNVKP